MGIKLEVGKWYVSRDGAATVQITGTSHDDLHPFKGSDGCVYGADGHWPYSAKEHCYDLVALASDEAPSGEAALDALTELDQLRERVRELEEWNRKMVEMAASKNNLDGYRELGQRAAQAESIADTLRAENARLREALERIANYEESMMRWQDIALAALTAKEPAR